MPLQEPHVRLVTGPQPVGEAGMRVAGFPRGAVLPAVHCHGVFPGRRVSLAGDLEGARRTAVGGVTIFDGARDATGVPDVGPMAFHNGVLRS
jgi:hypothetical protein